MLGECGKKYAVWARRGTAQRAQRTHRSPMAGTRQAEHALISARHTVRQHSRSDGLVFAARVRGGGLTGGRGDSRAWCAFWLAPRSFELATVPSLCAYLRRDVKAPSFGTFVSLISVVSQGKSRHAALPECLPDCLPD